jgi:LPS-assembly protein
MNLDFHHNRSAQKAVSNATWEKEILFPGGHIVSVKGILSFHGLKVSEKEDTDYDSSFGVTPQANVSWKWPLVFSSACVETIFTPIVGIIAAGNKKNTDIFEDQFCEVNDLNFYEGNKSISQYDVDAGKRVYYGFKLAGYKYGENFYRFTLGRSIEITDPPERLESSGLKRKNSDIVASTDVFLSNELTFVANGSYSTQSKRWTRAEVGINFSNKEVCFDAMIFSGKQCFYDPFRQELKEISEEQKIRKYKGVMFDVGWFATKKVKLKGGVVIGNDYEVLPTIVNPSTNGKCKLIRSSVGFEYKNECMSVDCSIERKNYRGGDLKPETGFRLTFHLKNLGI